MTPPPELNDSSRPDQFSSAASYQNLVPKSSLELQAQAAAFASEKLEGEERRQALESISAVTESSTHSEQARYVQFLREKGGQRHEDIRERAEHMRSYDATFRPITEQVLAQRGDQPDAAGSSSDIFMVKVDGSEYVIRAARPGRSQAETIDDPIAVAARINKLKNPHLEHLVAASYEPAVTVAEKMPGESLSKINTEDVRHMSEAQIEELIDTVTVLIGAGGEPDTTSEDNLLYDREAGFGIIDNWRSDHEAQVDTAQVVCDYIGALASVGWSRAERKTAEDFAAMPEKIEASRDLLDRITSVCERKFAGPDLERIHEELEDADDRLDQAYKNYSDPAWIADVIARLSPG